MCIYQFFRIFLWFLFGFLFVGFFITNGCDMGIGILSYCLVKNDYSRRIMINTIVPHWDGNQVWLVAIGGFLFSALPIVYSVIFSGFYVMMIFILSSLFFRPICFELRNKVCKFFVKNIIDFGIFFGSIVTPFFIGLIYANLFQGIPFFLGKNYEVYFLGNILNFFNIFSVISGILCVFIFLNQGSTYMQIRTIGSLKSKMERISQFCSIFIILLFVFIFFWIFFRVNGFHIIFLLNKKSFSLPFNKFVVTKIGFWSNNYLMYKKLFLFPSLCIFFSFITFYCSRIHKGIYAFLASCLNILCIILTSGFLLFPFIIPSSIDPSLSLTIWDSTSSLKTLILMVIISVVCIPIVLVYTFWCYYKMFCKLTKSYIKKHTKFLY